MHMVIRQIHRSSPSQSFFPYGIKWTALYATIVQEKYGDEKDSDSSPSDVEDDTAYVSVTIY